jgi:NhaP-type Na+/H+ or K+/H+ antiporter
VAAILAPTDAGLGQVIVTSPKVPARIRQALNVEAGLNDGLAVPFLMLFRARAAASADAQAPRLSTVIFQQLGIGSAIGIGVGLLGGYLLGMARRLGLMAREFEMLGVVTLPVLCLLASEALGASMFIAAFVAGLAVQIGFREAGEHAVEFTDSFGQVLNLAVFFLFGMLAFHRVGEFGPRVWLYAALSLTVIRMLPVAVALWGTGLDRATVLFMGWFGPRGLASIVLGLVYLEHHEGGAHPTIRLAVVATVLLSIFAHGATALPGIAWYARRS